MAKIGFISLGCDKNLVDSEVMVGLLKENGHIISDESDADVIVINTCCFIEDALKESIDCIIETGEMKKSRNLKIIVAGCLSERYKEKIFEQLPEVDIILGTTAYEKIAEAVESVLVGGRNQFFADIDAACEEPVSLKRELSVTGSHYAYLKIAEGCDNHCTYCIIPKIRGRYRSRTMESLIQEAGLLAEKGVKELVLVAQDTGRYGFDIYGKTMLTELMSALCGIDGIEWIRLMYCYPENVSAELIETIAAEPKICNYIDMPIQHISDKILKLMGRKTSGVDIKRIITELREKIDGITIRTSLITGFPGEDDADFNELLEFVKEYRLERVGVFPFSREEGTPAYNLKPRVDKKTSVKRKNMIMREQKRISSDICKSLIGTEMTVIVEGKIAGEDAYMCRSFMDAPGVDACVFVGREEELLTGDFTNTVIEGFSGYDLFGS